MSKYLTEILKDLNDTPDSAAKYANNGALKTLLSYAFDKNKKFVLPEGNPPFRPDAAPIGMSPANLMMETQRFYVFCRADLNPLRRESLFVQLLEGVHPSEADLILAIKDQDIGRIYPNITFEYVNEKGLVAIKPEDAAVAPVKSEPRGKGRPPGAKNKTKEDGMEPTTPATE